MSLSVIKRLPIQNGDKINRCCLPLWDFLVGCEFALRRAEPSASTCSAADSLKVGWCLVATSCKTTTTTATTTFALKIYKRQAVRLEQEHIWRKNTASTSTFDLDPERR